MSCEYYANGLLKPTGPWLTEDREDYYKDHPSFEPAFSHAVRNRAQPTSEPGNTVLANIWEFTPSIRPLPFSSFNRPQCRLRQCDYVTVALVPRSHAVGDPGTFLSPVIAAGDDYNLWAIGSARLELAIDEEFTDGFFVELDITKAAQTVPISLIPPVASIRTFGVSLLHQTIGPYISGYPARQLWFLMADSSAREDVAPHVYNPLPSWIQQQYFQYADGWTRHPVPRSLWSPTVNAAAWTWSDDTTETEFDSVDFLKATLRFGSLDGALLEERVDVGPEIALRHTTPQEGRPVSYLGLGVHNNRVYGYVADSHFSSQLYGNDWLLQRRRARLILKTGQDNGMIVKNTLGSHTVAARGPYLLTNDSAPSGRVETFGIKAYKIECSDATASALSDAAIAAATGPTGPSGPAALIWSPYNPSTVFARTAANNQAASFRASRIKGVAPMLQTPGAPTALSHNCPASTRPLTIKVRTIFQGETETNGVSNGVNEDGVEWAHLPYAFIKQTQDRLVDEVQTGYALDFTEAPRSPAPQTPFSTPEELAAYRQWLDDPYGGAPQDAATPGAVVNLGTDEHYGQLHAQLPSYPWHRHEGEAGHTIVLQQNAGQSVYVGNTVPTNVLKAVPTLQLASIGAGYASSLGTELGIVGPRELADVENPIPGAAYPKTKFFAQVTLNTRSSGTTETSITATGWKDTYTYDLWPQVVVAQLSAEDFYWPRKQFPSLPVWQKLAESRSFAAITEASYTPLQLDCAAWLTRDFGEGEAQYTQSEALADDSIPNEEALTFARRPVGDVDPAGGRITIQWRKTWEFNATIASGRAKATGSSSETIEGVLGDLRSAEGGPYTLPSSFNGEDEEVRSLQETVEVSWSTADAEQQTVKLNFEDFWATDLALTKEQWAELEAGEEVTFLIGGDSLLASSFDSKYNAELQFGEISRGYQTTPFIPEGGGFYYGVQAYLEITLHFA